MRYIGIQSQIARNNVNSILLLFAFPCIILGMLWIFCCILGYRTSYDGYSYIDFDTANQSWLSMMPWAVAIVIAWSLIAYFFHAQMIQHATGARALDRRENPRIYNMVENLCMTAGMPMPKVYVIDDPQLNAFASGINTKTYAVTLTTGIINLLSDEELNGVIAHELTHIRNRDTKVLIISIVFVGILSTLLTFLMRWGFNMFLFSGHSRRSSNERNNNGITALVVVVVATLCAAIAYFLTLLTRFAISRKREFMADAGGAELTRNPRALASALRKISADPGLGHVGREDIAQLYIIHPKLHAQSLADKFQSLFNTHPSTKERIRILEQF